MTSLDFTESVTHYSIYDSEDDNDYFSSTEDE